MSAFTDHIAWIGHTQITRHKLTEYDLSIADSLKGDDVCVPESIFVIETIVADKDWSILMKIRIQKFLNGNFIRVTIGKHEKDFDHNCDLDDILERYKPEYHADLKKAWKKAKWEEENTYGLLNVS